MEKFYIILPRALAKGNTKYNILWSGYTKLCVLARWPRCRDVNLDSANKTYLQE